MSKKSYKKKKYPYNCKECSVEYFSTKANEKRKINPLTCSSCSIKKLWTDKEYRKKHEEALKIAHNTEEVKIKHSKASLKNFENEEFKKQALERINSPKSREKAKNSIIEVWKDEDKVKQLISKMFKTRSRTVICSKGQVQVKSSYEERLIHLLDKLNLSWEYEPKTFYLEEMKKNYIPDFYIKELDVYVEVKGYWYKDAKEKWDYWLIKSPDIKKILINKQILIKLENGEKLENFIYQENGQK